MLLFTRVEVVGPSMEPTLRNGDWWVVRRTRRLGVGDIVLMAHPQRPDLRIVKRLDHREAGGWWVVSDNTAVSSGSGSFGVVPAGNLIGRLVWRYRPLRRGD